MKLTAKERKAIEMLRTLDGKQRDEILGQMKRQIAANQITARVGKLRKLKIVEDKKIVKAFGTAPFWKAQSKKS